jgi:hypothetical protein
MKLMRAVFLIFILTSQAWAVCISNKLAMDIDCECKKQKKCLQFSKSGMKNEIGFSIKNSDPAKVKKVYKYVIPAYKDMNKMFDGSKSNKEYRNIDIDKITEDTQKLEGINKKLLKSLEKQYQKRNKKFSFDKYKKYYNKQVKQALKKEIRKTNKVPSNIITKALGIKIPNVKVPENIDMNSSSIASNTNTPIKSVSDADDEVQIKKIVNDNSLTEEQKNRKLAQINAAKMKRIKFKFDDIQAQHTQIFDLISKRYRSVASRLDQGAIFKDRLKEEREAGVNFMIDSFLN